MKAGRGSWLRHNLTLHQVRFYFVQYFGGFYCISEQLIANRGKLKLTGRMEEL